MPDKHTLAIIAVALIPIAVYHLIEWRIDAQASRAARFSSLNGFVKFKPKKHWVARHALPIWLASVVIPSVTYAYASYPY